MLPYRKENIPLAPSPPKGLQHVHVPYIVPLQEADGRLLPLAVHRFTPLSSL